MDAFWVCSDCGATNIYPDITECEVCGKSITENEIEEAKKKISEITHNVKTELRREREENEKNRRIEKEKIQKEQEEKRNALRIENKKRFKNKKEIVINKMAIGCDYVGIVFFSLSVLFIVITTLRMSLSSALSGGWIFFIICSIVSFVASYLSYTSFHKKVKKDFAFVMTSGLLGALVTASTISDCWQNGILDMFNEGFLVVLFSGWLVLIFFVFVSVIAIILSIVITQVFPSYLQSKMSGNKGGLIGLMISCVIALLYLKFFEQDGLAIVLGQLGI